MLLRYLLEAGRHITVTTAPPLRQFPLCLRVYRKSSYSASFIAFITSQYCKISQVNGDTKQSKENLIKTIDLVNTAIQNITSSLFEKDELDMNVNMNVLEDLLKKDGLIDDQLTLSMEELYKKIK